MSSKQKIISKKDIDRLESIVDDAVELIYIYKVDSNSLDVNSKFNYLRNRLNREFNNNNRMVAR